MFSKIFQYLKIYKIYFQNIPPKEFFKIKKKQVSYLYEIWNWSKTCSKQFGISKKKTKWVQTCTNRYNKTISKFVFVQNFVFQNCLIIKIGSQTCLQKSRSEIVRN